MDYLNVLTRDNPKWTTLRFMADKFNDARTRKKNGAIDQQTQLRNSGDVTDLIPSRTFVTKYYNRKKGND